MKKVILILSIIIVELFISSNILASSRRYKNNGYYHFSRRYQLRILRYSKKRTKVADDVAGKATMYLMLMAGW